MTAKSAFAVVLTSLWAMFCQDFAQADFSISISCAKENTACPSAVGVVLGRESNGTYSNCTGTLIGKDRVLTNAHCVPRKIRANGAKLNDERDILFFPQGVPKGIPAKEIEYVSVASDLTKEESDDDEDSIKTTSTLSDTAIIVLSESVEGIPFEVSPNGLPESETSFRMYSARLDRKVKSSYEIVEKTCALSEFFHASNQKHNTHSPIIHIVGCQFDHGDSGSPLLDSQGRIWALGLSLIDYDAKSEEGQRIQNFILDGSLANTILATNLACSSRFGSRNALCDKVTEQYENIFDALRTTYNTESVDDIFGDDGIFWDLAERSTSTILKNLPKLSDDLGYHLMILSKHSPIAGEVRNTVGPQEWTKWVREAKYKPVTFVFAAPNCLNETVKTEQKLTPISQTVRLPVLVLRRGLTETITPRVKAYETGVTVTINVEVSENGIRFTDPKTNATLWRATTMPYCDGGAESHTDSMSLFKTGASE